MNILVYDNHGMLDQNRMLRYLPSRSHLAGTRMTLYVPQVLGTSIGRGHTGTVLP